MKRLITLVILSLVMGSFWVVGNTTPRSAASSDSPLTVMQDPASLDRRISMLEQRLYYFESSMRRLEQQVAQPTNSISNQQRTETVLLRNEVESLKAQLQTLACGLAKLDERTLQPSLRQSRRQNNDYVDPCRVNPETPLRLSTQQ